MSVQLNVKGDAQPEQIREAARLVRAYNAGATANAIGVTMFACLFLLLAFRCNDVTLWDLQTRQCVKEAP